MEILINIFVSFLIAGITIIISIRIGEQREPKRLFKVIIRKFNNLIGELNELHINHINFHFPIDIDNYQYDGRTYIFIKWFNKNIITIEHYLNDNYIRLSELLKEYINNIVISEANLRMKLITLNESKECFIIYSKSYVSEVLNKNEYPPIIIMLDKLITYQLTEMKEWDINVIDMCNNLNVYKKRRYDNFIVFNTIFNYFSSYTRDFEIAFDSFLLTEFYDLIDNRKDYFNCKDNYTTRQKSLLEEINKNKLYKRLSK